MRFDEKGRGTQGRARDGGGNGKQKNVFHRYGIKTDQVQWLLGKSGTGETRAETCVCGDGGNHVLHTQCALDLIFGRSPCAAPFLLPGAGMRSAARARFCSVKHCQRGPGHAADVGGVPVGVRADSRSGRHYG